ncbi:MAG: hypothetical protein PHH32_07265, partial [Eubacteriales bacterium]|nr:hypothetical protein [Eubacteriales bacterium]
VYGENKAHAYETLKAHGIAVSEKLESVARATVVYANERLTVEAEHTRFVEVPGAQDANNIVTAAQIVVAIFNMPFKQFAEQMKTWGMIDISDSEMEDLFVNSDSADGIVRIRPLSDRSEIDRITKLVAQAA